MDTVCIQSQENKSQGTQLCHWMLLSRKPIPESIVAAAGDVDVVNESVLWTDEWSNLLSVLR